MIPKNLPLITTETQNLRFETSQLSHLKFLFNFCLLQASVKDRIGVIPKPKDLKYIASEAENIPVSYFKVKLFLIKCCCWL